MFSTLYYPYLSIETENLIKQGLLLWDQIEVIDPISMRRRPNNGLLAKADELLVKSYVPTKKEKANAHDILVKFADTDLPPWFFFKTDGLRDFIVPEKFLPETWDVLQNRRLVGRGTREQFFWASPATSLLMMAVLADCCAGRTKRLVTDEASSYQALSGYLTLQNHGSVKLPTPDDDVLSIVPLKTFDLSSIRLDALLKMRERETQAGGQTLTDARHRLLKRLDKHVVEITDSAYSATDRVELDRQFDNEMNRDYADVKEELGWAGRDWLVSKEMGAVVIAAAAAVASPLMGALACVVGGVAALTSISRKYHAARKQIIKGHTTSYVYLARNQGFEWDIR